VGESHSGDIKATFTWEQSAPTSGTLRATVTKPGSAPEAYEGKFYQMTRDTQINTIADLWSPWYPGWRGWAFWGPEPEEPFVAHYTGHVVANLAGPDGQRMRCQLELLRSGEGDEGRGWGWLVAGGIGSLLVGVILLLGWPATALWATGLLLGINLIFTGLTRITLALASRTALVH
jgi:hypothetical protein